jgi:seryl-tRNA synthetase
MRDALRVGAEHLFNLPASLEDMARTIKNWVTKGAPAGYAEEFEEFERSERLKPPTAEDIAQVEAAITKLNTEAAKLINKAMLARKKGKKEQAKNIFAKVREQSAQITMLEEQLEQMTAAMESAEAAEQAQMPEPPVESGSPRLNQWQIRGPKPTKYQRPGARERVRNRLRQQSGPQE